MVNSFHHQTIQTLAPKFKAIAHATDGVIEAIEATNYPYLIGIQWHPEMFWRESLMDRLFSDFIKICESK